MQIQAPVFSSWGLSILRRNRMLFYRIMVIYAIMNHTIYYNYSSFLI